MIEAADTSRSEEASVTERSRYLPHSLNALRVFDVVARHQSIKLAADELCLTPSAVSQQIKALEDQLGVGLFVREPNRLRLTDVGRQYAADIHPLLNALEGVTRQLRERQLHDALLRVSLMPPVAHRVVLPGLADFRRLHPGITLRIDANVKDVDLSRRTVDVAIRFGVPPWPGCVHEKLLDVSIQPVCSPDIAHAYGLTEERLDALKHAPKVHMLERPDAWPLYAQSCGRDADVGGPHPQDIHVDDYPMAMESCVSAGVSLAVMPLEHGLVQAGRLLPVGPRQGPLPGGVYAVMLREREHDPAIGVFLDWLKACLIAHMSVTPGQPV